MKRKFITNSLADSMFSLLDGEKIQVSRVDIEDLKKEAEGNSDIISAIKNEKLAAALRNRYGIDFDVNNIKFTLAKGDILYVLNPGGSLSDDELPEWATISCKKYEVLEG